ncbi:winged helix-turn-helix domain-containing protein [Streptomyces macrosporus]|uniref:OmpR/PhoB-type domain-containing protein n=1 Tax=Streptomyces macrosporus TaxID=44032 RepID=A0ABP5WQP4_9ACTN
MNHTITVPTGTNDTVETVDRHTPERLVTYVVLAPETARVSDLFAQDLTVRRVERPRAEEPPEPPREPSSGLHVDPDRYTASIDGHPLDLTYLEFGLLAHLTAHPHRVHTRAHLMEAVWGYDHVGDSRTIDVHVARLRRKLGPVHRSSIATVRRVGYKYVPVARSA